MPATIATEQLSISYKGSTVESGNYKAGGDFKRAGPSYTTSTRCPLPHVTSMAMRWAHPAYESRPTTKSVFAARSANHLLELKVGIQDIPYQGFPNQRMDMTANDSQHANLRYQAPRLGHCSKPAYTTSRHATR